MKCLRLPVEMISLVAYDPPVGQGSLPFFKRVVALSFLSCSLLLSSANWWAGLSVELSLLSGVACKRKSLLLGKWFVSQGGKRRK